MSRETVAWVHYTGGVVVVSAMGDRFIGEDYSNEVEPDENPVFSYSWPTAQQVIDEALETLPGAKYITK